MELIELEKALQKAWKKNTSYCPDEWSADNPSLGQCAVTALVVNDHLGGEIIWAEAVLPGGKKISHYFNLVDGQVIDLTRSQFPIGTTIPPGIRKSKQFASTREYLLSNEATLKRYRLLNKAL